MVRSNFASIFAVSCTMMLLSCGTSLFMNLQSRADLPRYYRTSYYSRFTRCCSY